MSDKLKNSPANSAQEEVFEIIELAIDDLELLTKAFDLINDVCEDLKQPVEFLADPNSKGIILH